MTTPPTQPTGALDYTHTDSIMLPQSAVERRFAIRKLDWERLKRCVASCKSEQISNYSGWYFLLFGISGSSVVAIVPLIFSTGLPSWVVPAYGALAIASLVLGVVIFKISKSLKTQNANRIKDLEMDMAGIESGFDQT